MKKNCRVFVEDIAAFASDNAVLSTEAAAHLANCPRCREKIAELKPVAAMHWETSANLAEPKRRLRRPQLEGAITNKGWRRRDSEIPWRTVFAGALVLALIAGAVVTQRMPRERMDARSQPKLQHAEAKVGEKAIEPTLLTMHREVERGREQILARTAGAWIRHYRVKDVESELRN